LMMLFMIWLHSAQRQSTFANGIIEQFANYFLCP
jgi:hypothetical protein